MLKRALLILLTAAAVSYAEREARLFTWDNVSSLPNGKCYLGVYPATGNPSTASIIADPNEPGNKIVRFEENSTNYSKYYIAYIEGLRDSDRIFVRGKVKNESLFRMAFNCEGGRFWKGIGGTTDTGIAPFVFKYGGSIANGTTYDYGDNYPAWTTLEEEFVFVLGSPARTGAAIPVYAANDKNTSGVEYGYLDDIIIDVPFVDNNADGLNDIVITFPDGTRGEIVTIRPRCFVKPLGDIASPSDPNGIDCVCDMVDFSALSDQWGVKNEVDVWSNAAYKGYRHLLYGWEDPAILVDPNKALVPVGYDVNGNPYYTYHRPYWNVVAGGADTPGHALQCVMGSYLDSVQLYVAKIYGLKNGDKVAASIKAKKGSATGNVRMWSNYIYPDESYAGAAGGDAGYPVSQTEWSRLSHQWTYESMGTNGTRLGMVIHIRAYGEGNGQVAGLVDDLIVSIPSYAAVEFPNNASGTPEYQAPVSPERLKADLDLNNSIGLGDLSIIVSEWMKSGME